MKTYTIFTPDVKDKSLFELTKNYWNEEPVKLKVSTITFERIIGHVPKTTVIKGKKVSYDFLTQEEYFTEVFNRFF